MSGWQARSGRADVVVTWLWRAVGAAVAVTVVLAVAAVL